MTAKKAKPRDASQPRDLTQLRAVHRGVERELPSGGFVTVRASHGNFEYIRAHEAALDATRERLGLAVDQEIPTADLIAAQLFSQIGTCLLGFRGFALDGAELQATYDAAGRLVDDASSRLLLELPYTRSEIEEQINQLNAIARRSQKAAEGNSPASSAGTSATDGTSPTS